MQDMKAIGRKLGRSENHFCKYCKDGTRVFTALWYILLVETAVEDEGEGYTLRITLS